MKRGFIWITLTCIMVISMVLASCTTSTTSTSKPTSTTTSTPTSTITSTSKPTSTTTTTNSPTTTTAIGNWWDKLGTPQYGGTLTLPILQNIVSFDKYSTSGFSIVPLWEESMFAPDWTLDPAVFSYQILFAPSEFIKGRLAKSWEFTDPSTVVFHLRQGIHWQDIAPANGREFTSDDVVWHYNRLFGLGGGFTKPSSIAPSGAIYNKGVISLTAPDKYTVVFKWNTTNSEYISEIMEQIDTQPLIDNREAVEKWGDLKDWQHAVGTGPFILNDFVVNSSATLVRNPNYWGYDERYPKNQLPYIDTLKLLIIPDTATSVAAVRTGKCDAIEQMSLQQSKDMRKTNPEILQVTFPTGNTPSIDPRIDKAPFNDIRVREAMQMALDLPSLASIYYGGTCQPYPCSLTSYYITGWGFPYDQWPQGLKDEYAYNPTSAKKLLTDAGYPNGFNTDIVVQNTVDMDLLQIVQSYFTAVGINMQIRPMDPTAWISFVSANHSQDALAQRLSGLLAANLTPFKSLNRFLVGDSLNWVMVNDPAIQDFYDRLLAATNVAEAKKIIRDANQYVAQKHWVIAMLQPVLFGFYQPWFKGYDAQTFTISGGNSGLLNGGFFLARFWIDGTLKKSMGY